MNNSTTITIYSTINNQDIEATLNYQLIEADLEVGINVDYINDFDVIVNGNTILNLGTQWESEEINFNNAEEDILELHNNLQDVRQTANLY